MIRSATSAMPPRSQKLGPDPFGVRPHQSRSVSRAKLAYAEANCVQKWQAGESRPSALGSRLARGPLVHPGRRLESRRARPGPRLGRRAEAEAAGGRGAPPSPRADARDDLPEAVDADAGLVRGR